MNYSVETPLFFVSCYYTCENFKLPLGLITHPTLEIADLTVILTKAVLDLNIAKMLSQKCINYSLGVLTEKEKKSLDKTTTQTVDSF